MTFKEFLENSSELTDEAFKTKLKKALEEFMELDIAELRASAEYGDFDFIAEIECNDGFGTEGMNI